MINRMIRVFMMGFVVLLTACPGSDPDTDIQSNAEKGNEAAAAFCECFKKDTKDECLEKLKETYLAWEYTSDEFIKAFNKASTCGIELVLQKEKSASFGMEDGLPLNVKE